MDWSIDFFFCLTHKHGHDSKSRAQSFLIGSSLPTHHHRLYRRGSANVPSTNSSLFPSDVRILKIPIFIPFLIPPALYLPLVVVKGERLMVDVSPRLCEDRGHDIVVFFLAQSPVAVVVEEFIPGGPLDGTQDECEGARCQGCDAYCELPRVTGCWWCV